MPLSKGTLQVRDYVFLSAALEFHQQSVEAQEPELPDLRVGRWGLLVQALEWAWETPFQMLLIQAPQGRCAQMMQ